MPLRHSTVWDAEHTPVTEARQAVRALLARAGHPPSHPTSQDAQIVVSELVANAYRHAPGPGALLLEVVPDAALLRISVSDSSPDPPEPRAHDAGRIGGHGLHLVSRLCAQLNTVVSATGKKVVAHLRLHGTPADPVRQGAGAPMAGR
ncbi:ATP-binding protein [Streptomyces sp. LP11]|uniref:ATP-binding protein n=1 Tax=Streptomyces pyxinicus TaxID=2970331 RepID=A0ABT2B754_9ACTN|nr:ATP-binding protein [Streptomyces sp. LP11]MCS0604357.1 ATP-binding protein [Streptomyces sp. LP11]